MEKILKDVQRYNGHNIDPANTLPIGGVMTVCPLMNREFESVGGYFFKDGEYFGKSDISPFDSYDDSGLFLIYADGSKKAYRYCDDQGNLSKRIYGKDSSAFYNGFARVEIIDEKFDESLINKKAGQAYLTFLRKDKNGKLQVMKHRFAHATFMNKCGLGRVILFGEQKYTYVTSKGKVLPYRFSKASDCFRRGLAQVQLLNGKFAYLRENYDIVSIDKQGRTTVLTSLEMYIKKKLEGIPQAIDQPPQKISKRNIQEDETFSDLI